MFASNVRMILCLICCITGIANAGGNSPPAAANQGGAVGKSYIMNGSFDGNATMSGTLYNSDASGLNIPLNEGENRVDQNSNITQTTPAAGDDTQPAANVNNGAN